MAFLHYKLPEFSTNGSLISNEIVTESYEYAPGGLVSTHLMSLIAEGKGTGRATVQIKEAGRPTKTYTIKLDKAVTRTVRVDFKFQSAGAGEVSVVEDVDSITVVYNADLDTISTMKATMDVSGNLEAGTRVSIGENVTQGQGAHAFNRVLEPGKGHIECNLSVATTE